MSHTGKLKIFLGYAPGVGKTYQLLDEAKRRASRGQEVMIGSLDAHGRKATEEVAVGFPAVPPRVTKVNGRDQFDLDLDAILARKPELLIVDELAGTNAPGSKFPDRWRDVEFLLENGINVLSTLNVYNLESLNDSVFDITGVRIGTTVPDRLLHNADEVELVDLTPTALLNRVKRGDVYVGRDTPAELDSFFNEAALSALREIALREIAGHVDEDLAEYRKEKRIEKPWAAQDRVMICVSPTRSSLRLIRRGWRMGQRMHGEVIAVHVKDGTSDNENARKILKDDFELASKLGIETVTLEGSLAPTLINFARERNVTAVILGHPERSRLQEMLRPSILSELARELRTVDIIVVSTEASLPGQG
jgi:two-component system sensor histidine kinase KdpD